VVVFALSVCMRRAETGQEAHKTFFSLKSKYGVPRRGSETYNRGSLLFFADSDLVRSNSRASKRIDMRASQGSLKPCFGRS